MAPSLVSFSCSECTSSAILLLQTRFPSETPDAPCPVFAGFGDADAGAVGDGSCEDDGSTVKVSVASSGGQVLYWPSSWSCSLVLRSFDVWLPHLLGSRRKDVCKRMGLGRGRAIRGAAKPSVYSAWHEAKKRASLLNKDTTSRHNITVTLPFAHWH